MRDPDEVRRDYYDMMEAAGFCLKCKEHKPCSCEPDHEDTQDITNGAYLKEKHCVNCGSPHNTLGKFCNSRCAAQFIGEV